jgi:hypothetical protein
MDIIAKTILHQIFTLDQTILPLLFAKKIEALPETSQYEGGIEMIITTKKANRVKIILNWSDEYDIYFFKDELVVNEFKGAHFTDLPEVLRWALKID